MTQLFRLSAFVIEDAALQDTSESVRRGRIRSVLGGLESAYRPVGSRAQFEDALNDLRIWFHKRIRESNAGDRHLVILSFHGEAGTGTRLEIRASNELIDMHYHRAPFEVVPANCVIFLSVCWGAFPGVLSAVQCDSNVDRTVIGPRVSVKISHLLKLQDGVVDILLKREEYEPDLGALVASLNQPASTEYGGEPPFTIIERSGLETPTRRTSLAAPAVSATYRVVAIHGNDDGEPEWLALELLGRGQLWLVRALDLDLLRDPPQDAFEEINSVISLRAKMEEEARDEVPGVLSIDPGSKLSRKPKVEGGFTYAYAHCVEVPRGARGKRSVGDQQARPACIACNWAILEKFQTDRGSPNLYYTRITAACTREACPEHSR